MNHSHSFYFLSSLLTFHFPKPTSCESPETMHVPSLHVAQDTYAVLCNPSSFFISPFFSFIVSFYSFFNYFVYQLQFPFVFTVVFVQLRNHRHDPLSLYCMLLLENNWDDPLLSMINGEKLDYVYQVIIKTFWVFKTSKTNLAVLCFQYFADCNDPDENKISLNMSLFTILVPSCNLVNI